MALRIGQAPQACPSVRRTLLCRIADWAAVELGFPRAIREEEQPCWGGERRAGNWDAALIVNRRAGRLDEASRPARYCYWNSFRISWAFWLAIDSDWMPSCSCVWSACNWVDAVFIFASTKPEMPSE